MMQVFELKVDFSQVMLRDKASNTLFHEAELTAIGIDAAMFGTRLHKGEMSTSTGPITSPFNRQISQFSPIVGLKQDGTLKKQRPSMGKYKYHVIQRSSSGPPAGRCIPRIGLQNFGVPAESSSLIRAQVLTSSITLLH